MSGEAVGACARRREIESALVGIRNRKTFGRGRPADVAGANEEDMHAGNRIAATTLLP